MSFQDWEPRERKPSELIWSREMRRVSSFSAQTLAVIFGLFLAFVILSLLFCCRYFGALALVCCFGVLYDSRWLCDDRCFLRGCVDVKIDGGEKGKKT